ncbi:Peptidyl-prolyl cis-trans isomerase FKBP53 [Sesamum angolense]|uniref:peptidylprolyl isomerase n=1 Tax=Sesamum angolense TaxID=2727404 RepID=A0AAE2BGM1_9LAMI|nr:Peptidyl-prolyl cis-trans isomerase FKBP53 [Sesamum angolense]
MAFWGIEVKPGKPYIHLYDDERGRLHVSQATLGTGSSTKKSIVQCKVGDKKPIYLCSLLPERLETCALNLEFEEDDEVTFEIVGLIVCILLASSMVTMRIRIMREMLMGPIFMRRIMGTDSEDEDDSISYDSEDEDEEDNYTDDDFGMYPSSAVPNSGVRIEEIVDDEKPTNENGTSKRAKKKQPQSSMSNDNENSDRQIVVKAGTAKLEDTNNERIVEKTQKKNKKDEAAHIKSLKRKIDAVGQDGEPARENIEPRGSTAQPDTVIPENEVKQKKKKVAEKVASAPGNGMPNSKGTDESPVAEIGSDLKPSSEKKKEKKKKKQNKQQEVAPTPKELAMGKPDGKRASPGKKVGVHYIGKLKKNGKIFDSNIGRAPFKFRLGIGQVIKGWDVGVNGMRIGDKRRLTIPPAMGYGAKGCGPAIPPNSWLVFDVELLKGVVQDIEQKLISFLWVGGFNGGYCKAVVEQLPEVIEGVDRVIWKNSMLLLMHFSSFSRSSPLLGGLLLCMGHFECQGISSSLWLAVQERLSTADRPWLQHLPQAWRLCDSHQPETPEHIFIQCECSRRCLVRLRYKIRQSLSYGTWQQNAAWTTRRGRGQHLTNAANRAVLAALVYDIWHNRVFQDKMTVQ